MKTYTELEPHQQRVIDEKAELDIKIAALTKFTDHSDVFKGLPSEERLDLQDQLASMNFYSNALSRRIKRFEYEFGHEPVAPSKEHAIIAAKKFRAKADELLQQMKSRKEEMLSAGV